jgi:hypothetical protein
VKSIINEVTPEIELNLATPSNVRRREDLNLTVTFGYPEAIQQKLAYDLQQQYVQFYKQFLYALHNRQGKPFLEGYDWEGPGAPYTEKVLNQTSYKTLNKLGRLGSATVITIPSEDPDVEAGATIDQIVYDTTIAVNQASGIALSWENPSNHIIASSWDNSLSLYEPATEEDPASLTHLMTVGRSGETLVGVATDLAASDTVWTLFTTSTGSVVRWYDVTDGTQEGVYTLPGVFANDMQIDVTQGLLYLVGSAMPNVMILTLANGLAIDPDPSYPTGLSGSPSGISIAGGICYIVNTAGSIRMLYASNGDFAGVVDLGESANGLFVDPDNRRIYVVAANGSIRVYHANIAAATIDSPIDSMGAPAFGEILKGQFVHIVMANDHYHPTSATSTSSATYVVDHGDTLWSIAKHYYGSGTSWRTIYNANKAVIEARAKAAWPPNGYNGQGSQTGHWIFPGTHLTIPGVHGTTPPSTSSTTKYLFCYTKADWVERYEGDPIGIQGQQLIREWELKGDQVVGTALASSCKIQDPAVVIYGEEGRVNDWDPVRDGYGEYLEYKYYRTKTGRQRNEGPGWYPRDWDVVDTAWQIDVPDWPTGEAYLASYLRKRNAEVTVQSFSVVNRDNVWDKIKLGGVYTLHLSLQGPVPNGVTVNVRVLGFAPAELLGTCEITAETYVP